MNKDDLDIIQQEFEKFFKPKVSSTELHNIKLEENESLNNFSYRLEKALRLKYPKIDTAALTEIKRDLFIKALPKRIRIPILQENITAFEDVLRKAEHLKNIFEENDSPVKNNDKFNFHIDTNDKNNSTSKEHQHKKFYNRDKFQSRNKFRNNNNKYNSYKYNSQNNSFRNKKQGIVCSFCGKRYHYMRQCYEFLNLIGKNDRNKSDNSHNSRINRRNTNSSATSGSNLNASRD